MNASMSLCAVPIGTPVTRQPDRARALLAVAGARIGLCRQCRPGRVCDEHRQAAADAERYRADLAMAGVS